ncbi:unnamed protein product [Ectocarpus sp. 4 AP-2014]|uniref:EsV-1-165 n=1 Tax=Ectocarpus siliculosus virus 1 (isolate New Zealand/Kaikoura/1988) TaxID=654926 RepID=Q8QNB9_ESV1K|nr:EsV-1-165 [Ectocarpus siliculosus virus 1]AAK14579.1 EsV-1-165 [Ectocarpus siliculosus virus 1]
MDWICCLRKKKRLREAYDALRKDPESPSEEHEPAQYISASLDSEYDLENFHLKRTLTSLYKKVSEWSLPKKRKMNLFTVNEEEHDFLMNDIEVDNFDDVVDEKI